MIVRECIFSDIESLAILTTELGYPTTVSDMESRLTEISKNPNCRTIVAEINSVVVGYIGLLKSTSWEQNGCFIRIQALCVKSEYRKLGVGKALIDYAETWGKEISAKSLVLNSGNREERASAHKFYPKIGFEAKSTGYKKDI
jgi:GNAT superfamily N-acetyltransferase